MQQNPGAQQQGQTTQQQGITPQPGDKWELQVGGGVTVAENPQVPYPDRYRIIGANNSDSIRLMRNGQVAYRWDGQRWQAMSS